MPSSESRDRGGFNLMDQALWRDQIVVSDKALEVGHGRLGECGNWMGALTDTDVLKFVGTPPQNMKNGQFSLK